MYTLSTQIIDHLTRYLNHPQAPLSWIEGGELPLSLNISVFLGVLIYLPIKSFHIQSQGTEKGI